jgi:hypothetical protein
MADYPPSPVPSDRDLWPGELPFTAFGQWGEGHLDLRVLDQDVYWVDRHGTPHHLTTMTPTYRASVLAHLLEHVHSYWLATCRREVLQCVGDAWLHGTLGGELMAAALGALRTSDLEPRAWLESTPLMRRLRALTGVSAPPEP